MKLLKERTEPKRRETMKLEKKASFMSGMGTAFNRKLTFSIEKKLFKVVPPLKDYPEEIESEDSNASEDFEIIENDRVLAYEIGKF